MGTRPLIRLVLGILAVTAILGLAVNAMVNSPAKVDHTNVCIDVSPDGKTILFSSADGDLFLFDLATKTASRLTETDEIESFPSYSPDGKKIVFSAAKPHPAPYRIVEMDLASRTTKSLTNPTAESDILPRYTPDGKEIVFARAYRLRPYSMGGWTWDQWDIHKLAADGSGVTRLTHQEFYELSRIAPLQDGSMVFSAIFSDNSEKTKTQLCKLVPGASIEIMSPSKGDDVMTSPDEKSLTFISDREKPFWYGVFIGDQVRSRNLIGNQARYNRNPDFFPDGTRIAFLAGVEFGEAGRPVYHLWQVDTKGTVTELALSDLFTHPERWLKK
jgi:Tol biopolymer transport system component